MSKRIILIVVLLAALSGTAFVWLQNPGSGGGGSEAAGEGGGRLSELRRLKTLQLDTSILEDSFFRSLQPLPKVTNASETKPGRTNPFLPF